MADARDRVIRPEDALAYHEHPRPGKIEVTATKPLSTQYDLALAYSPGVAVPCEAIAADPGTAYDYTTKGNLVGVITEDDIIRYIFGRPARMGEKVRSAMRTSFLKVDKDTSVDNLVALLHGDSYAAVTENRGERFLGLITRSDVLNYLRRQI